MNKKTLLQVLMVFLIVLIFLLFYLKYFDETTEILEKKTTLDKVNIKQNSTSTYIDNINYVSSDMKGHRYRITAKQGEIKIENSNVMFLENVIAYIFMKDSDTIKVTSDFGKYNTINYDTIFSKNVIIVHPNHKITGEYANFSFLNNVGTITTNVAYTGNNTNLFSDKIEMNLTTKDTKIFMNDITEKVLVKGTK